MVGLHTCMHTSDNQELPSTDGDFPKRDVNTEFPCISSCPPIRPSMSTADYIVNAAGSLPNEVPRSAKVYKDDCMYSFDTPENNVNGLDVCMSCYQGFARAPHRNYTLDHYNRHKHALYVNIKKSLKPELERKSPLAADDSMDEDSSPQKKQPKLEVVEPKETDIYDMEHSVYVAPLDQSVPIEDAPAHAKQLAELILKANSADNDDEIKAWEQQVFPCEHSVDIQVVPGKPDLSKCAACDLRENLWICLTCGQIGCGREQFGSTLKGNTHALKHYEESGHAVAVKLGSLSADDEDNCDCYCYQCNDEVKVPQLGQKLIQFNVDLGAAVKTEKNLIEMNLERNKNWQFNLEGAHGEKLSPIFGPGLTGLQNLGNSCYLNSVIQALFSLPHYQQYFGELYFDELVPDPAQDLTSQMIKLYDGLLSGRYSKPSQLKGDDYQLGIKPSMFKYLVGSDHYEFKTNRQQDANEFLLYLLDKLDKNFGIGLNEKLKFLSGNKVLCTECKTGSLTYELIDNISVPVKTTVVGEDENGKKQYETTSLDESFLLLFEPEVIEGYQCDTCGNKTTSTKSSGFRTYPDILVASAQRIKLENWVPVKVDVPIEVPESIDVSKYSAPAMEQGEKEVASGSSDSKNEFAPNEEAMSMLLSMGFSEPRCHRGLFNTGNNNAEDAMNWIFAHMDDPDIDAPFDANLASVQAETASSSEPPAEMVENVAAMGFAPKLARKALILTGNEPNAAVEWLFSNPDDDGEIDESKPVINIQKETEELREKLLQSKPTTGKYNLKAVVCHKGTSPHTGHYVVFIKVDAKWVLFNDEKVVVCGGENLEDMRNCGYIYFFEKAFEDS